MLYENFQPQCLNIDIYIPLSPVSEEARIC